MKRFLITFSAVVAALIFVLVAIGFIGHFLQWERSKADGLKVLALREQHLQEITIEAKNYYLTKELDQAGADIAHSKDLLLIHYRQKPWLYSSEEQRQVKRWTEDVAAFNGRHYEKAAVIGAVEFSPVPTNKKMHFVSPPYPHEAEVKHLTGNGFARASFDDSGRCCNVVMTVSTGVGMLDVNTINFGQANWIGVPNTTEEVPVTYQLR